MLTTAVDPLKIEFLERAHQRPSNIDKRNIVDYDAYLRAATANFSTLDGLLDSAKIDETPIRWVDYCCGRGTAVRQGRHRYNRRNNGKLSAVGIDIRRFSHLTYESEPTFRSGQTTFFQADVETSVPTGLNPFLATCVNGLLYIRDPLRVIQQIYADLREGGYFLFTNDEGNEVIGTSAIGEPLSMWILNRLKHEQGLPIEGRLTIEGFVFLLKKDSRKAPSLDFGLRFYEAHQSLEMGWVKNHYLPPNFFD